MTRREQSPPAERSAQIDYVADNLLSRAALLVRLLVKQVPTGDVSRTEVEVLAVLREGPRRITELAELEGLAQPTMTVLVKRLETRGWVSRSGLRGDGRVHASLAVEHRALDAEGTFLLLLGVDDEPAVEQLAGAFDLRKQRAQEPRGAALRRDDGKRIGLEARNRCLGTGDERAIKAGTGLRRGRGIHAETVSRWKVRATSRGFAAVLFP